MSEEVIQNNEGNKPSKGKKFAAALKEWCRKRVVTLKVKPQIIPLLVMAITTIYFMLILYSVSQAIDSSSAESTTSATGICTFITTLLSLLYLVSFLNAFPKRKKPNIFFIVVVALMIAGQLACDLVYYFQMDNSISQKPALAPSIEPAQPYIIGHIVLLGISSVIFALLPVYAKLIRKINTSIKLESATENMKGNIDIED